MGEKLIIESDHTIDLLLNHNANFDSFELNLPGQSDEDNKQWTKILMKDYNPCGCTMGGKFVLSSLAISTIYLVFQFQNLFTEPLKIFGQIILFVFVMGLVGKLLGILFSKLKFRNNVEQLKAKLVPTLSS